MEECDTRKKTKVDRGEEVLVSVKGTLRRNYLVRDILLTPISSSI